MKNLFGSFVTTIGILFATTISGVLLARILLPTGRGELASIFLWPTFIAYGGSIGIAESIAYFMADKKFDAAVVLTSGFIIAGLLSVILVAIGWILFPLIYQNSSIVVLHSARLYLAIIPMNLVSLSFMGALTGRMRLSAVNFLRIFVHFFYLISIMFLYFIHQITVQRLSEASLATNLITMIISLGMVWKNRWLVWMPAMFMVRKLLSYGIRAHLGTFAAIANLRLDQLLMSILLSPKELGLYVVSVTVSSLATITSGAIGFVIFPHIANLETESEKIKTLGRFSRLALFLSAVIVGLIFCLIPWLLTTFFTNVYLPASMMARVLVIAALPLGFNNVLGAGLRALGRPLISSQAELTGLFTTAIALAFLLPIYGALGAAWASLLAYSAVSIFLLNALYRNFRISVNILLQPTVGDWNYVVDNGRIIYSMAKGGMGKRKI